MKVKNDRHEVLCSVGLLSEAYDSTRSTCKLASYQTVERKEQEKVKERHRYQNGESRGASARGCHMLRPARCDCDPGACRVLALED